MIAPPGFRLPAAATIGPVTLQVADLGRSLDYYSEVLGLREVDRSTDSATLASADGTPLVTLRERRGAVPLAQRARLGLYHFAILLPDRAALGRFIEHLSRMNIRAGMSDHLVSEAVYLTDPDGLGIEVYADRPRKDWVHDGDQLVMATEPLDVGAVVGAGAGERWSGMPAGTRMGHVHLFVGDLAAAERFYFDVLGFDKTVWSYPGALFMSVGGYHHHLGTNTWASGAKVADENDVRLLQWELRLPSTADTRSVLEHLRETGVDVQITERGGIIRDPWGTAVEIRA